MDPGRNDLVAATAELLRSGGTPAVTVDAVAQACGLPPAAVGGHFVSRQALVDAGQLARLHQVVVEVTAALGNAVEGAATPTEFRHAVDDHMAWLFGPEARDLAAERTEVVVYTRTRPALHDGLVEVLDGEVDTLVAILEVGRHKGWVRPAADLWAVAATLMALATGRVAVDAGGDPTSTRRWTQPLREVVHRELFGQPPPRRGASRTSLSRDRPGRGVAAR
jgi:AcrR family transcriptional regulator